MQYFLKQTIVLKNSQEKDNKVPPKSPALDPPLGVTVLAGGTLHGVVRKLCHSQTNSTHWSLKRVRIAEQGSHHTSNYSTKWHENFLHKLFPNLISKTRGAAIKTESPQL